MIMSFLGRHTIMIPKWVRADAWQIELRLTKQIDTPLMYRSHSKVHSSFLHADIPNSQEPGI